MHFKNVVFEGADYITEVECTHVRLGLKNAVDILEWAVMDDCIGHDGGLGHEGVALAGLSW